jgi:hypothetical protein
MTTDHTSQLWRRIAASAAILLAALSVGTAVAGTADAKPKTKPSASAAYGACVAQDGRATYAANGGHISSAEVDQIEEDCCTTLGGTFNLNPGGPYTECYLPDGTVIGDGQQPPAPPIGATAVPRAPQQSQLQ